MAGSVIIIGAGMGGLAAGIYGQGNGLKTRIFDKHSLLRREGKKFETGGLR